MKYGIYIVSFVLLFLMSCTKELEETAAQRIIKAEQIEGKPSEVLSLLKGISSSNLDNSLSVRWCIAFGKAANELNQNELIPLLDFIKALKNCDTPQEKAWINYFLGTAYFEQKNGYKAQEYYSEALVFAKENNDFELEGKIYFGMAEMYLFQNMLPESKNNYEQSVEAYIKAGNLQDEIRAKGRVSYCLIYMDSVQTALQYATETEKRAEKGNNITKSHIANALAFVYEALGDYKLAEDYALQAIKLDEINTASHYLRLAKVYIKQKEYQKAHRALNDASTANSRNKYVPMTSALFRSQAYKAAGDMVSYEYYFKEYKKLREYFDIPVYVYQIEALENKLDAQKKEISNFSLIEKLINPLLIFLIFLASVALIYTWVRMSKQEKELDESYQQIKDEYVGKLFGEIKKLNDNIISQLKD